MAATWSTELGVTTNLINIPYSTYRPGLVARTTNTPGFSVCGDENNASLSKTHPDGRPFSRRTYDYIEYVPDPVDRLFVGGGAVLYGSGPIVIDTQIYTFDLDTFVWTTGTQDTASAGIGSVAAVAADGRIWQQGGGILGAFSDFDPRQRHGDHPRALQRRFRKRRDGGDRPGTRALRDDRQRVYLHL